MPRAVKTLSPSDLNRLLTTLEHRNPDPAYIRNYLMILFMADAGLRVGELVRLVASDLDAGGRLIDALVIRADIAKYSRSRVVPLTHRLRQALSAYVTEERSTWASPTAWVFPSPYRRTEHITPRAVQAMLALAGAEALGRELHPHMLRHTFGTELARRAPIHVVQELMGHRHISSTQVYTHPDHQDLKDAIDSLGRPRV